MFVCISLAWTKSRYWGDFPRGESRKYWFFHWESWNGICQTTVTCGICFSYNFQSLCFKLRCDWHRNLYSFQVYNLRIQYLCINITLFWNMSQIQGNRWYMMFELVHSQKSYVTVTTLDILSADFPGSFWAHYFLCNDRIPLFFLKWKISPEVMAFFNSNILIWDVWKNSEYEHAFRARTTLRWWAERHQEWLTY